MKKPLFNISYLKLFAVLCLELVSLVVSGQKVSLCVKSNDGGQPIPSVLIEVNGAYQAISDNQGKAELDLSTFPAQVQLRCLGFNTLIDTIHEKSTVPKVFLMKPSEHIMEEVEVVSTEDKEQLIAAQRIKLGSVEIAQQPSLGEGDIIKTFVRQSGVSDGGESVGGYYVRGGGVDQNLVLLDGATVFNSGHLFGFFSVFNVQAIEGAELFKGGFPSSMGGRVSSIMNIEAKEPDLQQFNGSLRASTIASSGSVELPIVKDKLGLALSGRRTYIDRIAELLFEEGSEARNTLSPYFYDLNAKLSYHPSDKDHLTITSFFGKDVYQNTSTRNSGFRNHIDWSNQAQAVNWTHMWSENVRQHVNFNYSGYRVNYEAELLNYHIDIRSEITQYGLGTVLNFENWINDHDLMLHGDWKRYLVIPNTFNISASDTELNTTDEERLNANEISFSLADSWSISPRTLLTIGGRLSAYSLQGPFVRFNSTQEFTTEVDTVLYDSNDNLASYHNFEPRVSLLHQLGSRSSVSAAFDVMSQYLHLAPVSSVSLPTDVWVPSSDRVRPQVGRQYSLSYSYDNNDQNLGLNIGLYHKQVDGVVEYRNGILLGYGTFGNNYDDNLLSGKSYSNGLELSLNKEVGQFDFELNYTLSKSERQFDELNQGERFPSKQDNRHQFNLFVDYQPIDRLTLIANFVYNTGNSITVPTGRYILGGNVISDYQGRNNLRLPPYHRLDVSAQWRGRKDGIWSLSIFNVYNRRNPYYVYFDLSGSLEELELDISLRQLSLFSVIPSVSYEWFF